MKTQRLITMKPAFLEGIMALPTKEVQQVMKKINLLSQDPLPDGKVKLQLANQSSKVYRLRSGDHRILYRFDQSCVNVLTIRRRNEQTYKQDVEADEAIALPDDLATADGDERALHASIPPWERYIPPREPEDKPFPQPLTSELLQRLRVPGEYHPRLLQLQTQNALLACPGVPDEYLLRIDQHMFELPLPEVVQQRDLVLTDTDDLLRYKEGELLSFLLRLSPEQEKYARWSLHTSGPTLVKGTPGTGKSTIALYRIRSFLAQYPRGGHAPRLLFTTYTNALVKSSEQQLRQLLGEDAAYVRVQTADKLAYDILAEHGQVKEIAGRDQQRAHLLQAISSISFTGNALQQMAQRQTLEHLGDDYLLQELNTVIIARGVESLEHYLSTPRFGRKVRLNATQRQLVWRIYERWRDLLAASGRESWQQRRARAEALVVSSAEYRRYDAVIIDEAQDLDPSLLRLLVKLCKAPERLFLTADANQSIYGSGFNWNDVHERLKFQGRTSILRANYRSTHEIGEAAHSYLADGALDEDHQERRYINSGPLPDVCSVMQSDQEAELLARFFRKACRDLRLTIGSCAVLCPNERVGKALATSLRGMDIEAHFMPGQELNLARPGVKLLTLSSAKGLEFPIVALAGLVSSPYPVLSRDASPEEVEEAMARARRTLFVGMTRAMRALLVIVPGENYSPLLQGFDSRYWNKNRNI